MKRILVAGCGDVGCRVADHFHGGGDEVFGLRRNVEKLPSFIRPVRADLTDAATLKDLPGEIDLLFIIITADEFSEAGYQRAYVEGTRNILGALPEVKRAIFVSSTSVYGQQQGEWVDEASPTEPVGFSGRCMLEAERLVLESPAPGMVVRLGGIYGQGRRALLRRVAEGKATLNPGPPQYVNLNHMEDVAASLVHLAGLKDPDPVYLATDGNPPDRNELITWMASQLGMPTPPMAETSSGGRRRDSNKRCRNDRLVETGYRFAYPDFRSGYGELQR